MNHYMKKVFNKLIENKTIGYITLFLIIFLSFIITFPIRQSFNTIIKIIVILFSIYFSFKIVKSKKNSIDIKYIIKFVIFFGILIRIIYMINCDISLTNHDLGQLKVKGNYTYLYNLYYYGKLPQSYNGQFYHPPFFYILATIIMKIFNLIYSNLDFIKILESSKIISCYASCLSLFIVKKILDEINIKENLKIFPILVITFLPIFYLMIGFVNNDCLVTTFILLIILYLIKWYKNSNIKNISILALCIGFGIMTKISCGIMALFILPLFIIKLIKNFKTDKVFYLVNQFLIFGAICLPLGLWYPMKNFILFGQPFTYVPIPRLNSINNISIFKRLFYFPIKDIFLNPFFDLSKDVHIITNIVKTSLFDEVTFEGTIFSNMFSFMIIFNIILIIFSSISMIFFQFKNKIIDKKLNILSIYLWILFYVSYIIMNIKYPFVCTANFRYIPITAIIGSIYLGYFYSFCMNSKNKIINIIGKSILLCLLFFTFSSIALCISI